MWLENKNNYSLKASFFTENNFEFKPGELLSWSPLWLIIFIIFLVGFVYVRGIKLEELFHQHSPKGDKKTIVEKREIRED
jgi:D-alanyl-lipoteichoic acid acyltransferase DltB (MBOAT superfamily)